MTSSGSFIFSYNQSAEFIGEELSLNPLKLDELPKSAQDQEVSPVTETLWLSPTNDCAEDYYSFSEDDNDIGKNLKIQCSKAKKVFYRHQFFR